MIDHVKLEIAIQLVAEKIADLNRLIANTNDQSLLSKYKINLKIEFEERDRVAHGEIRVVERILKERNDKNYGYEKEF